MIGRRTAPRVDVDQLSADLREFARRLDGAIADLASGDGAPPGFDARHFLAPGVPRVRPLLVLLSARAAEVEDARRDVDPAAAEHVAIAAELLHFAVLVHDAALGRPGGRRRRVARALLSRTVGFLGGNHLTLRAMELVRVAPAPEILGDLVEAMRDIAEGHALREGCRGRQPSPDEALRIAEHTGAAIFHFACRAGARLAGAPRPVVTALSRYGRHTGLAWTVADDLVAFDGTLPVDGPGGLEDRLAHGRPSVVLSWATADDPGVHAAAIAAAQTLDPARMQALIDRVRATGALRQARALLVREAWAARQALSSLPASRSRDTLDGLAAHLARVGGGPEPAPEPDQGQS